VDRDFLIGREELNLRYAMPAGERALSFEHTGGDFAAWRDRCKPKLADLLGFQDPSAAAVTELRRTTHESVEVRALVMAVAGNLSIPAYLLTPPEIADPAAAVMAIHGHNTDAAAMCLGLAGGGYNQFALALAQAGRRVLLPVHRGFGVLRDLAHGRADRRLEYEASMHFSYVTDAFLRGRTVVGENVEDLLRWEHWLAETLSVERVHAAGLSYGGDLALVYPLFSRRVATIFASGSCASMEAHFDRCYNGPAHCIPGILKWMDRADVAGMNAPRPLLLHFGQHDTPCLQPGRENYAAAYNEYADDLIRQAEAIYAAAGAAGKVRLVVTEGMGHAMDVPALKAFLEAN